MPLYDAYGREIRRSEIPAGLDVFYQTSEIPPLTGWDVAKAKAAADAHDQGDFTLSGRLYWSMLSDPRVADGVGKHALAVRGLPHEVVPGKGQAAKTVARKWEETLPRALPDAMQSEMWGQALLPGLSVAQVIWQYDHNGETNPRTNAPWYLPCVEPWDPTATRIQMGWGGLGALLGQERYDRDLIIARTQGSVSQEGAWEEVVVKPGSGQWLCFSLMGGMRPWLFGRLRTLWRPWISRQMAMLLWLRFNDVHGVPIREVRIPMGMRKTEEGQDFYKTIKTIGRDATLLAPQLTEGALAGKVGVELRLIEAVSKSWESLRALLQDYGREITIDLTGGTQNTEAEGGNYKGAEEQREIRHEVKAAGARSWQAFVNAQLGIPFAMLNGYTADEAAQILYDVDPPANTKAAAEAAEAGGKALTAIAEAKHWLKSAGYDVPVEALAASMGRKLPPGEVVEVTMLPTKSPGSEGPDPKSQPGQ